MAKYSTSMGLKLPKGGAGFLHRVGPAIEEFKAKKAEANELGEQEDIEKTVEKLSRLHASLSLRISPATPRSLRETEGADGFFSMMRTIPLVRYMLIVGVLSLVSFGLLHCLSDLGWEAWQQELFFQLKLVVAGALGASFNALYTAKKYVTNKTFDSRYVSTYVVRFILGIIAGPILANVFGEMGFINTGTSEGTLAIGMATVSLLGGYSAEAVNQILNRLVQTLTALVKGSERDLLKSVEEQSKARMGRQMLADRREISRKLGEVKKLAKDSETQQLIDEALDYLASELDG